MILHIPHASTVIPESWGSIFLLSREDLDREILKMTDAFTDELFEGETEIGFETLRFPVSRLLVDPERFPDDSDEPMATRGMGAVYTTTQDGRPLKSADQADQLKEEFYFPHHARLTSLVSERLETYGRCLIVDCHSYPAERLPCDQDQTQYRPDFCIGTDSVHTPSILVETARRFFEERGFTVGIDTPYAGSIVPMQYCGKDPRVASIMVEVNRTLYMDEANGTKSDGFQNVKQTIDALLTLLSKTWESDMGALDVPGS